MSSPIEDRQLDMTSWATRTENIINTLTQLMTPGTPVFSDLTWLYNPDVWDTLQVSLLAELQKQDWSTKYVVGPKSTRKMLRALSVFLNFRCHHFVG